MEEHFGAIRTEAEHPPALVSAQAWLGAVTQRERVEKMAWGSRLARINIIICYFPAQILPQRDLRGLHQCSFASLRNSFSCNWEHPVCKEPSQGRFSAWNQVKNLFAVETQVVWTLPSWGRNFPYCTSHSPEKTSRGAEHLAELRLLHLPEVRCSTPRVWMCRWTSTQTRSVFLLLRKGWFFEQPRSPWAGQALSADQPMQTRSAHFKSQ